MARKLATLRTIDFIESIPNADRIQLAAVGGWNVIVGKGLHRLGGQVIYCEIDSALPVPSDRLDPDGTLAKRGTKKINGQDYHVLKTIRLRGVYSQGLILPLAALPAATRFRVHIARALGIDLDGTDVSQALGIIKYDPTEIQPEATRPWWKFWAKAVPATARRTNPNLIGPFPTEFARKSDSERAQNLDRKWGEIAPLPWRVTEKIDGQSITLINDGGQLRIATRNWEVAEHPAKQWALERGFLDEVPHGMAVQGEWAGPGIQGNGLDLDEPQFFAFSQFEDGKPVGLTGWALDRGVPFLRWIEPYDYSTPADLLEDVDGLKSVINPKRLAEGVVLHHNYPVEVLGGRTTFKAISNKWLLKNQ